MSYWSKQCTEPLLYKHIRQNTAVQSTEVTYRNVVWDVGIMSSLRQQTNWFIGVSLNVYRFHGNNGDGPLRLHVNLGDWLPPRLHVNEGGGHKIKKVHVN